jgi:AhpD family alkylhydroperoxidase
MTHPVMVLPDAMNALQAVNKAIEDRLPLRTHQLVHLRASQINGCSACVDMHAKALKEAGVPDNHVIAVSAWRDTAFFSEAERAALALAEAVTRMSDRDDPVPDALWYEVKNSYGEPEIAALLLTIAQINLWNRLNVPIRQMVGAWKDAA